jgi:hypothetical protein
MKTIILFFYLGFNLVITAQVESDKAENTKPSVNENIAIALSDWDPIRGLWLSQSVVAMSNKQPVPDRTFAEELTPYEMLSLMPKERREDLKNYIETNNSTSQVDNNQYASLLLALLNNTFCSTTQGRSYGDPHLKSFDNATYSFQTVGEFDLSKSSDGNFEIQARQKAQSDNFSLNTAIAMNVFGDRLGFYAEDAPSRNVSPLFLDGQPIQLQGRTYFLPHGGTIRLTGRNYIVSWPSGETMILNNGGSGGMNFVNVTVTIFQCGSQTYSGLLGNANNNMNDDFNGRNNNQTPPSYQAFSTFGNPMMQQASILAEKEYLAYLSQNFAEDWRVNDMTTLFDYAAGTNTAYYTDRSFPRVHLTVADLNADQQANARRRCETMGINASEMGGCIFDQAYLNINPNPIPTPTPATDGVVLNKLERPLLNTNTHQILDPKNPDGGAQTVKPIDNTMEEKPGKSDIKTNENNEQNKPTFKPNNSIEINKPNNNNNINTAPRVIPSKPIISSPVKPTINAKPGKG